jgi:PAS domain-containing protein
MPEQDQLSPLLDAEFLYQHAPSGHISFTPDGKIHRVNETLCTWLGRPASEVFQSNLSSILTKAGTMYFQMVINPMLSLQGSVNEISLVLVTREQRLDILFDATAHKDAHGQVVLINASIHRIADRKKYEKELMQEKRVAEEEQKRFKFLANSTPNMIFTALPDGQINFINDRVRDYFNFGNPADYSKFIGVYPSDRRSLLLSWRNCMKTGKVLEKELRFQAKNKEPEWYLFRVEPYYNEAGNIELWFGSATNINKQKLQQIASHSSLSSSLSSAQKIITENQDTFEQIAMNQSHMIRRPLANIMGLIPLLNTASASDDSATILQMLQDSILELDKHLKNVVKHAESKDREF